MRTVIGLGIFVGTGQCNANCEHCAGTPHRKNAHKFDGEIDKELIEDVIKFQNEKRNICHKYGAGSFD